MKTVGSILSAQREKRNLSLEDTHKFIKIHPKYLKAIENDDYSVFEGKVHAKGFLRIYSEFLGLDPFEILALWRREYEPTFDKSKHEKFFRIKPLETSKIIITPATLAGVSIFILIILFFGYLYFQYRSYTDSPKLEIYHPENNILVSSDILDITGKTDLDADVFINNQKVVLSQDGGFAISIKLKEGLNTLSFVALNKLDKKTEIVRTIIYRPNQAASSKEVTESTQSTQPSK